MSKSRFRALDPGGTRAGASPLFAHQPELSADNWLELPADNWLVDGRVDATGA
jgi:hypothetical protein